MDTLKEKEKDIEKEKDQVQDKEKEIFDLARKKYPGTKRGIDTEYSNFKKKHSDWKEIVNSLFPAIEVQIKFRNQLHSHGKFVPDWKNMQTWINNRCWEDEMSEQIYKKILTADGKPKTQAQIREMLGKSTPKHQFLGMEDEEL